MPLDLVNAAWKTGSRSNGTGGSNCVEVAFLDRGVAVRDSKDRQGPMLMFTFREWLAFVESAKEGEFDLRHHLESVR